MLDIKINARCLIESSTFDQQIYNVFLNNVLLTYIESCPSKKKTYIEICIMNLLCVALVFIEGYTLLLGKPLLHIFQINPLILEFLQNIFFKYVIIS